MLEWKSARYGKIPSIRLNRATPVASAHAVWKASGSPGLGWLDSSSRRLVATRVGTEYYAVDENEVAQYGVWGPRGARDIPNGGFGKPTQLASPLASGTALRPERRQGLSGYAHTYALLLDVFLVRVCKYWVPT